MYMALHIADVEISQLVTKLASLEKTTKTEALRRLLRRELEGRELREQRRKFHELALQIIKESRPQGFHPPTKDEIDDMWGQ